MTKTVSNEYEGYLDLNIAEIEQELAAAAAVKERGIYEIEESLLGPLPNSDKEFCVAEMAEILLNMSQEDNMFSLNRKLTEELIKIAKNSKNEEVVKNILTIIEKVCPVERGSKEALNIRDLLSTVERKIKDSDWFIKNDKSIEAKIRYWNVTGYFVSKFTEDDLSRLLSVAQSAKSHEDISNILDLSSYLEKYDYSNFKLKQILPKIVISTEVALLGLKRSKEDISTIIKIAEVAKISVKFLKLQKSPIPYSEQIDLRNNSLMVAKNMLQIIEVITKEKEYDDEEIVRASLSIISAIKFSIDNEQKNSMILKDFITNATEISKKIIRRTRDDRVVLAISELLLSKSKLLLLDKFSHAFSSDLEFALDIATGTTNKDIRIKATEAIATMIKDTEVKKGENNREKNLFMSGEGFAGGKGKALEERLKKIMEIVLNGAGKGDDFSYKIGSNIASIISSLIFVELDRMQIYLKLSRDDVSEINKEFQKRFAIKEVFQLLINTANAAEDDVDRSNVVSALYFLIKENPDAEEFITEEMLRAITKTISSAQNPKIIGLEAAKLVKSIIQPNVRNQFGLFDLKNLMSILGKISNKENMDIILEMLEVIFENKIASDADIVLMTREMVQKNITLNSFNSGHFNKMIGVIKVIIQRIEKEDRDPKIVSDIAVVVGRIMHSCFHHQIDIDDHLLEGDIANYMLKLVGESKDLYISKDVVEIPMHGAIVAISIMQKFSSLAVNKDGFLLDVATSAISREITKENRSSIEELVNILSIALQCAPLELRREKANASFEALLNIVDASKTANESEFAKTSLRAIILITSNSFPIPYFFQNIEPLKALIKIINSSEMPAIKKYFNQIGPEAIRHITGRIAAGILRAVYKNHVAQSQFSTKDGVMAIENILNILSCDEVLKELDDYSKSEIISAMGLILGANPSIELQKQFSTKGIAESIKKIRSHKASQATTMRIDYVIMAITRGNPEAKVLFSTPEVQEQMAHLKDIIEAYKANNSRVAIETRSFEELIFRILNEAIDIRGQKQVIAEALPIIETLKEKPVNLEYVDEVAKHYLGACVNRPLAGAMEIHALMNIAKASTIREKIEAAKALMVYFAVRGYVESTLPPNQKSNLNGLIAEAVVLLVKKSCETLLERGEIKEQFPGIPQKTVYDTSPKLIDFISKNQEMAYEKALEAMKSDEEAIMSVLCGQYLKFWRLQFPEIVAKMRNDEDDRYYFGLAMELQSIDFEEIVGSETEGFTEEEIEKFKSKLTKASKDCEEPSALEKVSGDLSFKFNNDVIFKLTNEKLADEIKEEKYFLEIIKSAKEKLIDVDFAAFATEDEKEKFIKLYQEHEKTNPQELSDLIKKLSNLQEKIDKIFEKLKIPKAHEGKRKADDEISEGPAQKNNIRKEHSLDDDNQEEYQRLFNNDLREIDEGVVEVGFLDDVIRGSKQASEAVAISSDVVCGDEEEYGAGAAAAADYPPAPRQLSAREGKRKMAPGHFKDYDSQDEDSPEGAAVRSSKVTRLSGGLDFSRPL